MRRQDRRERGRLGVLISALMLISALLIGVPASEPAGAQANIVFVDISRAGSANTGTSWANAYTNLSTALANAGNNTELWVAEGTYKPSASDQTASFEIPAGAVVFGGFEGDETARSQRNPSQHFTVLSGEINSGVDVDNSENIVVIDNADGARLDGVIITGGYADGANPDGGGIRVTNSTDVVIANTRVANSFASGTGGAVYIGNSTAAIISSQLDTSEAATAGALHASGGTVVMTNVLAFGNEGLNVLRFADGTEGFLTNLTVADNRETNGTVSSAFGGSASLTNSIVRDNASSSFAGPATFATFSNIEGGAAGTGNSDVDPLFEADYSLGFSSPSIDAGDTTAVPLDFFDIDDDGDTAESTPDLFRADRVSETAVDQGAIESIFCPRDIYVDQSNTSPNQTGTEWGSAFSDLQDGLALATACGDDHLAFVRVAGGTYKPTASANDQSASFVLTTRTNLIGGYAPGGSPEPDPEVHLTLLTGDILGNDGTVTELDHPNRADNSYRVVVAEGRVIDIVGLRIEGGNAIGPAAEEQVGAGIYADMSGSLEIRDVEIRRNASKEAGGGLAIFAEPGIPTGAQVVNSEILLNHSSLGGGIAVLRGTVTLINTTMRVNTADSGGGFFVSEGGIDLRNALIVQNEAEVGGAGLVTDGTVTTVTISTIADNVGRSEGGAFAGEGQPFSFEVSNSIVWANQSDGEPVFFNIEEREVTYSTVEGGEPGTGNLATDPKFVSPLSNNYRLDDTSPSIDAGLVSLLPSDIADLDADGSSFEPHSVDLDASTRVFGFAVDHGAYESTTGGSCGSGTVVFVDRSNAGLQNGESWSTAFTDLQTGLLKADSCDQIDEIRIAEGTYTPSTATLSGRQIPFEIRGGLTVTGGYPARGGATSDPMSYETILSGDLEGNDDGALGINNQTRIDNSELVVDLLVDEAAPTTVMNLTIADGHDNGIVSQSTASGIRLSTGRLIGVRVERNVARSDSSGLEARNPVGVQIVNSSITGNGDEPAIGVFTGNFLDAPGPTQYDIEIVNTAIVDNEAGSMAIDANNNTGSRPVDVTLVNSLVADNGASIDLDGVADIDVHAINSTIANNGSFFSGEITGPAINAEVVLDNSILWDTGDGFIQANAPDVSAVATSSTVSGGTIAGSFDIDPEFVDPANGDYRLLGSSDLIDLGSNALIAADTADLDGDGNTAEDVPFDLDGGPRARNSSVDIGAFETVADDLTVLKTPCVVYDSTSAIGGLSGTLVGGELRTVQVAGSLNGQGGEGPCIPDDATLALVTITAVDPQAGGNLRLSAAGVVPTGGVVNYADNGLFNSNTVAVPLSEGGAVDIFANGGPFGAGQPSTDVRLTVLAFANEDGTEQFVPITPCAAHDSRSDQGADGDWQGPFPSGAGPDPIDVVGQFPQEQGGGNATCDIPDDATGIVANVVAVKPGGDTGYLSISPVGEEHGEPLTNFTVLTPTMNNAATVVVPLEGDGQLRILVEGENDAFTETRLVILGYTTEKEAGRLVPIDACAAFDTRAEQGATGAFAGPRDGAEATSYQISGVIPTAQGGNNGGSCEVPNSATAVLLNLVAIQATGPGNLQAYATGTTPTGGVLNFNGLTPAMNNSNAVIVPLSSSGELTVNVNGGPFGVGVPLAEIRGVVLGYFD